MSKILHTSLLAIVLTATSNVAFAADIGKKTYTESCSACHASGVLNSPKFGSVSAWAPRIARGKASLYASAINGKGSMPPKGGQTHLSDAVIKAAVDYMVSKSSKL